MLFPEGFQEALQQLFKVLGDSKNSYRIEVYRYEGQPSYKADVHITHVADSCTIE